jgi:hypothetical protein
VQALAHSNVQKDEHMDDAARRAVSRRSVIAGLTGTGALLAGAVPAGASTSLGPVRAAVGDGALEPAAIDPAVTGLTYATIDAAAFVPATGGRYSDDTSGTGVLTPPATLLAPLGLPTGSVIRQVHIAYQGTPTVTVVARPLLTPQSTSNVLSATLAAGGGAKTQTLSGSVTVEANTTYSIRLACQAGDSVYGVIVGYLPPVQGFVPFSGTPRVLDTRASGGKLLAGEERTIGLGVAGVRGAVVNLTLTGTEGAGGYVAVFPGGIAWPGNSSANWSGPGQNIANSVITAVDAAGQIVIRGGDNATHVIIDRIGWLV